MTKLTEEDVRKIVDDLQNEFDEKVINQTSLDADDFVEDYFLPKLEEIRDSGFFTERRRKSIERMRTSLSTMKQQLEEQQGLLDPNSSQLNNTINNLKNGIYVHLSKLGEFCEELYEKPIVTTGLGKVTPAEQEVTEKQIHLARPEVLSGPESSYIINKPPEDWIIKELTQAELIAENLKIAHSPLKEELFKTAEQPLTREILMFKSKREISVIPILGKTTVDGRKFPTALEFFIPIQLTIAPMNRASAPFFVERPLVHNFSSAVAEVLRIGAATMRDLKLGTTPTSRRPYLLAEFRQEIENAIVSGREGKNILGNYTLIGIEGELRDHLLVMNYPSLPEAGEPELEQDLQTLKSLVSSFQPVKILNPDVKLKKIRKTAEQNYRDFLTKAGKDMFYAELGVLVVRLASLDMDNPEDCLKAVRSLKPFQMFAKEIKLQDQELDELWDSLGEAETGNTTNFKRIFTRAMKTIFESVKKKDGPGEI